MILKISNKRFLLGYIYCPFMPIQTIIYLVDVNQ